MTKNRQPRPSGLPMATGFAWYRRETYAKCLAIFEDSANLPGTFDEWLVLAEHAEQQAIRGGANVVRAEIDPVQFPRWCADNGHAHVNSQARTAFANAVAFESIQNGKHGNGTSKNQ